MYEKYLNKDKTNMDIKELTGLLDELIGLGRTQFEISGGGEPLEYADFDKLLKYINQKHDEDNEQKLKFGLLTNGKLINEYDVHTLQKAFNDYIRISRYEKTISNAKNNLKLNSEWIENVRSLIKIKNPANTWNIGIKYLITAENRAKMIARIKTDYKDFLPDVSHVRIKSDCTLGDKTKAAIECEHKLFNIFNGKNKSPIKGLSINLSNTHYPASHECWISPVQTVIDPECNVHLCCNYTSDKRCIGQIDREHGYSFQKIWDGKQHQEVINDLEIKHCTGNKCCNCRFMDIQVKMEKIMAEVGYRGLLKKPEISNGGNN